MAKSIMIIDDSKLSRETLKMVFEQSGYRVITAGDGNEAVELLKKEKPGAILLDLILPGLDGFGVLGLIKSNPDTKYIPVFVLTGRDSAEEKEEAMRLGAMDCFIKYRMPPLEILKNIKTILG